MKKIVYLIALTFSLAIGTAHLTYADVKENDVPQKILKISENYEATDSVLMFDYDVYVFKDLGKVLAPGNRVEISVEILNDTQNTVLLPKSKATSMFTRGVPVRPQYTVEDMKIMYQNWWLYGFETQNGNTIDLTPVAGFNNVEFLDAGGVISEVSLFNEDIYLKPNESFTFNMSFYFHIDGDNRTQLKSIVAKLALPVVTELGSVNVDYTDEVGTLLESSETLVGEIGSPYSTTPKEIEGYTLTSISGQPDGVFGEDLQTVKYIYSKNSKANPHPVVIHYIDENGNKIIDSDSLTGTVGTPFTITPKTIDGYTFNKAIGETSGVFTESDQTITLIYTKNITMSSGKTIINYVDENNQNLVENDILIGEIGTAYTTKPKAIKGYKLISVEGNEKSVFSQTEQIVVYVYQQVATSNHNVPKTSDSTLYFPFIIMGLIAASGYIVLRKKNSSKLR